MGIFVLLGRRDGALRAFSPCRVGFWAAGAVVLLVIHVGRPLAALRLFAQSRIPRMINFDAEDADCEATLWARRLGIESSRHAPAARALAMRRFAHAGRGDVHEEDPFGGDGRHHRVC